RVTLNSCNSSLLTGLIGGVDQKLQGVAEPTLSTVYKIGSSTGVTQGRIVAIEMSNIVAGYDIGDLSFQDTIEIESADGKVFSDGGDSGAMIIDPNMCAV